MNVLLWLAYKGTNYAGFQVQPNAPTVCSTLQDAMQAVLGCRPDVKGCSRTDAGVHARRFALNFHYDGKVPLRQLPLAFNAHLPPDIRVLEALPVPEDFHARYAAHAKTYAYRIRSGAVDDPFDSDFTLSPRRAPGRRTARRAGRRRPAAAGGSHHAGSLRAGTVRSAQVKTIPTPKRAQLHRPEHRGPGGMRREGTVMSEIIRCEHLRYVYNPGLPDETVALDDVNFSMEEGDFVGIIGSTGSGKSTLISHFNGLDRPTAGRILIDGQDMWAPGADLRSFRFLVGLVFQYPEYQLFEETCARDIAYGPRNMGLDEAEIARRVEEAAAFTGLDRALLERSPFELSGGQKRRVAIAGVMAMEPRILVLDEPAAGLDPEGRDTILTQIKEYHRKTGVTVVLVSHSMEDIAKYADKVLVMHRAHVAMYDTVEKVFARAPELLELGLSVPQVTQIFLRLKEMGLDIKTDVYTMPYAVKTVLKAWNARHPDKALPIERGDSHAS